MGPKVKDRLLTLALVCMLLLVGTPASSSGGTDLVVALPNDVAGLDPAVLDDTVSLLVTAQIYETLVAFAPGGVLPVSGLAQSWSTSADGLRLTFNLRPGARFHDGTPADAAAVAYNFSRWWDPAHPAHQVGFVVFERVFGGFKGDPACLLTQVAVTGAQQVQLTLRTPFSPLISQLASPALAIASPAALQGGTLAVAPVGSGPFEFGEWTAGDHILLTANAGSTPRAWADRLTFRVLPQSQDRLAALQAGGADIAYALSGDDQAVANQNSRLKSSQQAPLTIGYLGMNNAAAPLNDVRVRRALAHAVDWQQVVQASYDAGAQAAIALVPPSVWGTDPSVTGYAYAPDLARTLLAQAGYGSGFTIELALRDVYRGYMPHPVATANAISADLAKVGITAQVKIYGSAEFISKVYAGELPLYLVGWYPELPHPAGFYGLLCEDNLSFGGQDAQLCAQLDDALAASDFAQQLAIYQSASVRVHESVPLAPVSHGTGKMITLRRNVIGLQPSPVEMESFAGVWLGLHSLYLPLIRK